MLKSQENLYKKAYEYISNEEYEKSSTLFKILCDLDFSNENTFFMAGISLYLIDKYEEAITFFDKAIDLDDSYFQALIYKSWSYFLLGDYENALNISAEAYELESNPEILFLESSILLELEEFENANEFLELYLNSTTKDDLNYTDVLFKKAICLFSLGGETRRLEALELIDKSLLINHNDPEFLNFKGLLLVSHDDELADELFAKSIENNPDWEVPYLNLAKLYLDDGLIDSSIVLFEKSLEINDKLADAWYYRALAYKSKGEYLISKKSLEKALNLNEENFDYILAMGQILDELGDDNSEEYYDKFLVIGDEFGEEYFGKYYEFTHEPIESYSKLNYIDISLKKDKLYSFSLLNKITDKKIENFIEFKGFNEDSTKEISEEISVIDENIEIQVAEYGGKEDIITDSEEKTQEPSNDSENDFEVDGYINVVHSDVEEDLSHVSYGRWELDEEEYLKQEEDDYIIITNEDLANQTENNMNSSSINSNNLDLDNMSSPDTNPKESSNEDIKISIEDDFNNEEINVESELLKNRLHTDEIDSKELELNKINKNLKNISSRFYEENFDNNQEIQRINNEDLKNKLNPFKLKKERNKKIFK